MSGSGGSGYSGGSQDYRDSCEDLVVDTLLASPKDDVVDELQEGQILDVAIIRNDQSIIVAILLNGQVAGGVASPQVNQLRTCLEKGQEFEAKIQSINGGQIKVRISAKRSS